MGKIENYQDLQKELAHLKVVKLEQEALLHADIEVLKNYLKPKYLLRSMVTPSGDESTIGHLLKNGAGVGAGILANKLLFRNASWLVRGALGLAVKSLTTGALNADAVRTGVKGFLDKFRKNGKATSTVKA